MKIFVATYSARRDTIIPFAGHTKDEALTACANEIRQDFYRNGDVPSDPYKLLMKAQQDGFIKSFDVRETELHMPIIVADVSGGVFNGVHIDANESELDLTIVMVDSDTEIGADHCIVESNSCLADNNQIYGSIFKPMRLDGLLANDIVDALRRKGDEVAAEQSMASTNTHPTA